MPEGSRLARTLAELRAWRRQAPGPVGLVPTMGCLHAGHLSLVHASRRDCARTVVSIFVNPAQFGPNEDYARYPRQLERDRALLAEAGVDLVFAPEAAEIYPGGFSTRVEVAGITERLEGAARPGHFAGVATVVAKLFNLVQPDRAYFGQKDAQQLLVIKKMVRDLDFPLELVGMPIVREPDGLALSSRNAYLSPAERRAALVVPGTIRAAQQAYAAGERDARSLRATMRATIAAEPGAAIDYVSVADPNTLEELERLEGPALASLAVRVGTTRLIDNTLLPPA